MSEIELKLGDIIFIHDETNDLLNNNTFLIQYIDAKKIQLVNLDNTLEKITLTISEDGVVGDGSIQSIDILSRNPEQGYARQNNLLPNTWVNILFDDGEPVFITGKITNLENDMIELKTTDNDTLNIDFAYQGIPEQLPIQYIEIRPPPPSSKTKTNATDAVADDIANDIANENAFDMDIDAAINEDFQNEEDTINVPIKSIQTNLRNMILDIDDIQFGDNLVITEYRHVDKKHMRYDVDTQANSLLEEILSTIPNNQRTTLALNSIHTMIERFLQLRQLSSTFDANQNVTGAIRHSPNDRPLADYLASFKNRLYWILLVAKNVKKIYSSKELDYVDSGDTVEVDLADQLTRQMRHHRKTNTENGKPFNPLNRNSFTYATLEPFTTPFETPQINTTNDVFSMNDGIIVEANVESELNAIIDNLGDLYSTVVHNKDMVSRRFIIQRYNLAAEKLHADNFKGSHLITHRVKVGQNDEIAIKSILTLPEPTVQFSKVNLPGTDLLTKTNLSRHFLNYWQLLKPQTQIVPISIDDLNYDLQYTDNNFIDNVKLYSLNLTDKERPENIDNLDIYKIFLKTIVPKTSVLFSSVEKYIHGKLSLVNVIQSLEPFCIYPIDVTYQQYRQMTRFIRTKIQQYRSTRAELVRIFSMLKGTRKFKGSNNYQFTNPLYNLLQNGSNFTFAKEIATEYDSNFDFHHMTISGSEFLKQITLADYGNLYNTGVAFTNIDLMFPSNLSTLFNRDNDKLKQLLQKDKSKDSCVNYVIAKKYYSKTTLDNDNDKTIFFDKEYDTTNYDLLDDPKYKKQQRILPADEFLLFLTDDLKTKKRMDEASAEHMAKTLINQAKEVRDGDFAILVTTKTIQDTTELLPNEMIYFVRRGNKWVKDESVDPSLFLQDTDLLCNMDFKCMYKEKGTTCESTEVSKDTIVQTALKQIMDQFDEKYNISKVELNSKIESQLAYFQNSFNKIKEMRRKQFLKYNNQRHKLGESIAGEMEETILSPYIKLRNLIMGQSDFIKRQHDIVRFVSLYCHEGNPDNASIHDSGMENPWWYYCNQTNTQLLPKFHYLLASAFINAPESYETVLNQLKKEIGKRSDDGDAWVDVNSGEIICYIDLDESEGFTNGFVNRTRGIIEKDLNEIIDEQLNAAKAGFGEDAEVDINIDAITMDTGTTSMAPAITAASTTKTQTLLNPNSKIISNVISTLANNMGIHIDDACRNFVLKTVNELMEDNSIIKSEKRYKLLVQQEEKKGKKIQSYESLFSKTILYLTLGCFLIAIQTAIPAIVANKTFSNCKTPFDGFPLEGEGNDCAVSYVASVALKSKDSKTVPWMTLNGKKEDDIKDTLKIYINKFLLSYPAIRDRLQAKIAHMQVNPVEVTLIPEEHDVTLWTNFLPPLKRFKLSNVEPVSDGFITDLYQMIKSGNAAQINKLLVIDAKIITFSLAIQEAIQSQISKKSLILKSSSDKLFMDNACCNEDGKSKDTALQYFINDASSIETDNTIVATLSEVLTKIKDATEASIALSSINTKRMFPPVAADDFSEETIYKAFIAFCKFHSAVPLSTNLEQLCAGKPDYLGKMDSIQEKINKLKQDGRNYTKDSFLHLFQLVSAENIIPLALDQPVINCVDVLQKIIDTHDTHDASNNDLEGKDKDLLDKDYDKLLKLLKPLVDTHDVSLKKDTQEMRALKNYLPDANKKMREQISKFIKQFVTSSSSKKQLKQLDDFLTKISSWTFSERNEMSLTDDGLCNYVNFMKNYIELISVVFPNTILNHNRHTIEPHKYWKLIMTHEHSLIDLIQKFYKPIESFYHTNETVPALRQVLQSVISATKRIYLLSKVTPMYSPIRANNTYQSFDRMIVQYLYEYYFLQIMMQYISFASDPAMLHDPEDELYDRGFLQSSAVGEDEDVGGKGLRLKQTVADLLATYVAKMQEMKKIADVSYDQIKDKMFRAKEAEKHTLTDRFKHMTQEERDLEMLKKANKLGMWVKRDVRSYTGDQFMEDKLLANRLAILEKKQLEADGNGNVADDDDMEDDGSKLFDENEIDMDSDAGDGNGEEDDDGYGSDDNNDDY